MLLGHVIRFHFLSFLLQQQFGFPSTLLFSHRPKQFLEHKSSSTSLLYNYYEKWWPSFLKIKISKYPCKFVTYIFKKWKPIKTIHTLSLWLGNFQLEILIQTRISWSSFHSIFRSETYKPVWLGVFVLSQIFDKFDKADIWIPLPRALTDRYGLLQLLRYYHYHHQLQTT